MKSTKTNKQPFTMEDFEQGLMLAGFITPASVKELIEREALDEYEIALDAKSRRNKSNLFFKRVTLAAEIASQMHNEPTFGRIKFQKLVYLCENAASMNLNERYAKLAAGPFDRKFMHSIEKQFENHKWFKVEKVVSGNNKRSVYSPLDKIDEYKKYYRSYFKSHNDKIQYILKLFRKETTDTTEIVATLYACMVELQKESDSIAQDKLLSKFYGWSEKKNRFKQERILQLWQWMNENQIVPNHISHL